MQISLDSDNHGETKTIGRGGEDYAFERKTPRGKTQGVRRNSNIFRSVLQM